MIKDITEPKLLNNYLFEMLVCPECQVALRLDTQKKLGTQDLVITNGKLICPKCLISFPIINGIPRILPRRDEKIKKRTGRNFGYEWKVFPQQFDFYQEEFLDWIWPVKPQDFQGKIVLDAGCGNGRHLYLSAKFGAKEIVGFDLSNSIEVARKKTQENKNILLLQSDIYHLPLRPVFDYIYCIGVLHHLPDPEKGFHHLVELLKKGGKISIWVYGKEGNFLVRRFVDPIRLHVASKLPMPLTFILSFPLAVLFHIIAKYFYRPLNKYKATKFITRYFPLNDYLCYAANFNFIYNFSTVFDQLLAATTHYISKEEVESWFKKSGLVDVVISCRNNNSWRATGTKSV